MTTFLGCLMTPILSFSTLISGSEKKYYDQGQDLGVKKTMSEITALSSHS
jgi:hypothetical protein